jgi:hypothetical protein
MRTATSSLLIVLVAFVLLLTGRSLAQQKPAGAYNSQIKYAGEYKSNILFTRHSKKDTWQRKLHMDRLRRVSCQDALDHLNSEGKWQGTLKPDGSCGNVSIESPEWALGNRINYDNALEQPGN